MKRIPSIVIGFLSALVLCTALFIAIVRPSNARDWSIDQAVQPTIRLNGDSITIGNMRDFTYRSTTDYSPAYQTGSYRVQDVRRVWYVVEPFINQPEGFAHTLVSFEFADGRYLPISVEIRKEKGEKFSPIKGLLRQYELMYVIGTERDLIGLRANFRHDDVYLYPLALDPVASEQMLIAMLQRAQAVQVQPEFYNTITNNCTTNIIDPLQPLMSNSIPWSYKIALPGYSDAFLYDLGAFPTTQSFAEYKAAHKINDLALQYADDPDFSQKIRSRLQ